MSEQETVTVSKSTDEGVTVGDAKEVIEEIDNLEDLEEFAGEEAADEDGRAGVKKAYEAKKQELEADPVVVVGQKEAALVAANLDAKRVADAEVRPNNQKLNAVDQAFEEAYKTVSAVFEDDATEVELSEAQYNQVLEAVKVKANQAREQRGMMMPSKADRALGEALETIKGWAPEEKQ